ncbi:hypothetical protein VHEMI02431 [[Torrubiella] hemipterigena]|uniref:Peptide hydrolase n=1 Tax=[Torrubiella] hemipterigena TaxID=1531966 RepID=A0A0A1SVQ0_9HYPO|nr:hypothetical protein VHEMI02431 [[Torrubiella] hemipterigena]
MAILNGEKPYETASSQKFPDKMLQVEAAKKFIAATSMDAPKAWMKALTDFNSRNYKSKNAAEAAAYILDAAKKAAAPNNKITPPAIVTLPGEKPDVVILGAHFDSAAGQPDSRAPGADDNASGRTIVLEALRVITKEGFKPKNTIEFHFYAAEEAGLLGAKDTYGKYKADKKSVIGFLNKDMTGWQPSKTPGLITDHASSAMVDYMDKLIKEYTGKAPTRTKCGYGCSDHAPATANGFPAVFVFEDEFDKRSPNIHSAKDTMDKIQWDAMERHMKLSMGWLVEASYIEKS